MAKSTQLNQWLWKWHVIAGLACLPVVAVLCATGSIYLFKDNFNDYRYQDARFIEAPANAKLAPYQQQLNAAKEHTDHSIMSVSLPSHPEQAASFREHAKGHSRNLIYVNPYTAKVSGSYEQADSLMYKVRKLHGELLLGDTGSLVVELVASWFIVLALTGIYIWWPARSFTDKEGKVRKGGFFTIRRNNGQRFFWRDMHAVIAFWMSVFLLVILAGGMPWTTLFGDNLKWVQKQTDTGYPQHWRNAKGLKSELSLELSSERGSNNTTNSLSLDKVVAIAKAQNLDGEITIKLPKNDEGVYTIANRSLWLEQQKVIHIDQYSGDVIKSLNWSQVGILMDLRQVFMRLHQGEYGKANLIVVLIVALSFLLATIASLTSYLLRKPNGSWGIPKPPKSFKPGVFVTLMIVGLALLFPAFGISALVIFIAEFSIRRLSKKRST